ncbi:acyl-CoA dehydrogenase family protein [Amycolatopsis sp. NBC_01286]|uniref:acyl-CoA dehydrogenase family protein n=1 Tax=Amycolatopsis sp. NBC_01286 TaxID=2903560 RepID=UPI002E113127|nr:acyl-CoA dehydrogenase family protein [Amycolatopsis sp. NBC_01286]
MPPPGYAPRSASSRRTSCTDAPGPRALDHAVAYVKERKQFGKRIAEYQSIRDRVDDRAAAAARRDVVPSRGPRRRSPRRRRHGR